MLRAPRNETEVPFLLGQLSSVGEEAPTVDEKLQLLQSMRGHSKDTAKQVDLFLVEEISRLHQGLNDARGSQEELRGMLQELTAPPWHPAIFLGHAPTEKGDAAMVMHGGSRRVVGLSDEVDPFSLEVGDEILLGNELNVVVGRSPYRFFQSGETAAFDRFTPDQRLVLKWRDEEIIVDAAGPLRQIELKSGDLIRWDRNVWLAFEKIEQSAGNQLFLEEVPDETFENIGGLDRQIETLQRSINLHLNHPEIVRKYRLRRKGSVLLVGPPGTGKTMMAKALANWLGRISKSGRSRFINIKPAGLHSEWYGRSEANYREAFRVAREAGEQEPEVPVVMFFDEVDAIGRARGSSYMRVDDRVLTAFMTELDGLEARGNIMVVAATNRRDALDPALLRAGRLGDVTIEVPRPNMKAARDIFSKHLHPELPYSTASSASGQVARKQIIEAAVAAIYSPNGESDLATITLRDGKRRVVKARDLISGAGIAKIAAEAADCAGIREAETGEIGIGLHDLLSAIADEFESQARTLSPENCKSYLSDLPQDVDVVRVEPIQRKVARPHRYLHAA